jgi:hypothetical protein
VRPGAAEVADGVDQDCDGTVDEGTERYDDDADGFSEIGGDCDDGSAPVFPGAEELANGVDDDCDGLIDEGLDDHDADGFAAPEDCDDADGWANPDAIEVCDGVDNDCDGELDEQCLEEGEALPGKAGGCGCDGSGSRSLVGLGLAAMVVLGRRRSGRTSR